MKCKVHNNANYEGLDSLAEDLFKFAHKRFNFTKPVTIVFESSMDNVGKLFAPTGHYDPQSSKVIIYVDHRHPKDILRSLAHELVHHRQNCAGHFAGQVSTDPGYAQRDQHMREMEGDAYRTGNIMLFRDWEDNYKQGSIMMNENKERLEEVEEEEEEELPSGEEEEEGPEGVEITPEEEARLKAMALAKAKKANESVEHKATDKQWYQNQLHEALLKKFKIKK